MNRANGDYDDEDEYNVEGLAFLIASQFPFESCVASRAILTMLPGFIEAGLAARKRRLEPPLK
jgi:hypothetical protein